jgi:hypothetical protein
MAGVLVGGLLAGGIGGIIGGLSGKTKSSSIVERIDLRIIVNDASDPIHDIAFLRNTEDNNRKYDEAIKLARRWHGTLQVVIRQAEQDIGKAQPSPPASDTRKAFVSDELRKLADLKVAGVITEAEFQQQKAKILAE